MTGADNFEDFLQRAFSVGVPEPEYEADMASSLEVPPELKRRVLEQARRASADLFARRLLEAAAESGWSREDLVHETLGHEREAEALLEGKGDPRDVTSAGLARLLWRLQLDPSRWRDLLTQTVTSFVVFVRPTEGQIFGRTTGLAGERRAEALSGGELVRDPRRGWQEATSFVEEVEDEWTTLVSGKMTDEPDSE